MFLVFPRVQPLARTTWIIVRYGMIPIGRNQCTPGKVNIYLHPFTYSYKDITWDVYSNKGRVSKADVKRIILEDPILVRF
jgi:hypothetical protein